MCKFTVYHTLFTVQLNSLNYKKNNKWAKILNLSPLEQKIHSFNTFYITEYTNTYKHVLKRLLHLSFKTFYFTPCVSRVSRLSFLLFDVLIACLHSKINQFCVPLLLPEVYYNLYKIYIVGTWVIRLIYHRIYIKKMVHQGLRL